MHSVTLPKWNVMLTLILGIAMVVPHVSMVAALEEEAPVVAKRAEVVPRLGERHAADEGRGCGYDEWGVL